MYCKMCGKKVDDTDRHCRFCGAPTGYREADTNAADVDEKADKTEEVVFNPPFEDELNESLHLTEEEIQEQHRPEETLKGFISDHEIKKQQELEKADEGPAKNSEFVWNIHEFPKTKKTEDVEFDWKPDEFGQPAQKEPAAAAFEEELFKEIREDASRIRESNIDRFFTFSKKNEEFQDLLDKEYEKFNRKVGVSDKEYTTASSNSKETKTESQAEEAEEVPNGKQSNSQVEKPEPLKAESETTVETERSEQKESKNQIAGEPGKDAPGDNVEETDAADTGTDSAIENTAEQNNPRPEEEAASDRALHKAFKAEHLNEMEQARAMFFGEELVKDNETIIKKLSSDTGVEDTEAEVVKAKATPVNINEPEKEEATVEESILPTEDNQAALSEPDEILKETTENPTSQEIHRQTTKKIIQTAQVQEILKNEEVLQTGMILKEAGAAGTAQPAQAAQLPQDEKIEKEISDSKPPKDSETEYDKNKQPQKEEKEKKANRAGTIVLIVIAIILAAEIAILAIRFYAPDSGASRAIDKAQNAVAGVVSDTTDRISNLLSGNDSTDKGKQEDQTKTDQTKADQQKDNAGEEQQTPDQTKAAPDPVPMADKDALIASQIGNNVNIQQVKANTSLAYQEGRDYGLKDINQSKPITNNIWTTTDGGETIYYDKSVVGTVIAFDSQWIDYVNRGSKGILNLLKKDSPAYKKTVSYSKVGKISENFRQLEIGEIRQGATGFYVWVHEEIQITEKGTTKTQKYNWIYYLEPVDGKMNIVNYFKFK